MGMKTRAAMPRMKTRLVPRGKCSGLTAAVGINFSRESVREKNSKGTIKEMRLGTKRVEINFHELTRSSIQSIVVVTSPIGDHAPPAVAAARIMPADRKRAL